MERYFQLPNPNLKSYFGRVVKGNSEEYRTPFASGQSLQEVLSEWEPTLNSIITPWPSLVEFENDLRAKVGPMSIMKPLRDRMEDIDSYYASVLLEATPISDSAIAAVLQEFSPIGKLRVRDQLITVDKMKKSTNSGAPYFAKRNSVLDKTLYTSVRWTGERVLMYLNRTPSNIFSTFSKAGTKYEGCAILGWRGQEGGPDESDVKQRVVWMFPLSVNIKELQVYQPLIEACQSFDLVPAWVSMEEVDRRITQMFDTKSPDDLVICTDFSKFDQHFNTSCQECAKTILSKLLYNDMKSQYWLDYVFPIKYNIPLCYNFGKLKYGPHGMGSGSGGTNADETLTHRALQYEAAQLNGAQLNVNSQCLGDDGVLTYPGITVEDVVSSYTKHGLEMNPDKQYASANDCVYLRRWHHQDYRVNGVCAGVYSTYRALGRLMEQERFYDPRKWNETMVALRQLSILENVKYHPAKEQFVQFCMKKDKYELGRLIPGFLDNVDRIAKEAIDVMPDFLGYTRSEQAQSGGLSEWWVVKYLKSL